VEKLGKGLKSERVRRSEKRKSDGQRRTEKIESEKFEKKSEKIRWAEEYKNGKGKIRKAWKRVER